MSSHCDHDLEDCNFFIIIFCITLQLMMMHHDNKFVCKRFSTVTLTLNTATQYFHKTSRLMVLQLHHQTKSGWGEGGLVQKV